MARNRLAHLFAGLATRAFRRRIAPEPARECAYADGKDYGRCDDGPVETYQLVDGLGIPMAKPMDLCEYHAFRSSNGEM